MRETLENDSCDVGVHPFSNIQSETEKSDIVEVHASVAQFVHSEQ